MGSAQTYRDGVWAEYLAMLWLLARGYRPLASRFKTPVGEIDLIAKKGGMIIFVEVKKRKKADDAAAAISPDNMARVRRAAEWWLKRNAAVADKCDIRFDAVAIANYCRIQHIPNAF